MYSFAIKRVSDLILNSKKQGETSISPSLLNVIYKTVGWLSTEVFCVTTQISTCYGVILTEKILGYKRDIFAGGIC